MPFSFTARASLVVVSMEMSCLIQMGDLSIDVDSTTLQILSRYFYKNSYLKISHSFCLRRVIGTGTLYTIRVDKPVSVIPVSVI